MMTISCLQHVLNQQTRGSCVKAYPLTHRCCLIGRSTLHNKDQRIPPARILSTVLLYQMVPPSTEDRKQRSNAAFLSTKVRRQSTREAGNCRRRSPPKLISFETDGMQSLWRRSSTSGRV